MKFPANQGSAYCYLRVSACICGSIFKGSSARGLEQRGAGFTLAELAVAIAVIAVAAALLLDRLAYYQGMAEKAAMESVARAVKTGLQLHLAELIATRRQGEAAALEAEDPMRWLEARPGNYGGVYSAGAEGGKWYFDAGRRHLVYVVNAGDRLEIDTRAAAKEIRFQARLLKDRVSFAGGAVESVTAVTLSPVAPYKWQ
jgi:prepilin-type N-terminal cleavage/methylation domain-containing protein